jgi:putative DNA primase/helicase
MTIQCLNEYPKVKDRSDSFYRRQIFIPFEKSFTGKENKNIKSQYLQDKEVLEYVLYKVLNTDYYELDEPESCKQAKSDYKESNDPIRQFWDEFESQFVWDILPFGFLFDLYKAWYDKNFPRSQQVSRNQFITSLVTMVNRESTTFKCDDTKQQLRPGDKMSKTEKLIGQYDLKDWYATIYQGRDMTKRCTLTSGDLHASYRGLTRK